MVNQYDKLRKDLQQVKEWRKVALTVAIDGPGSQGGAAFDKRATGEAASLEMQVLQSTALTLLAFIIMIAEHFRMNQELVRAYTQFGHLSSASGHTLKKNPDLHLHNAGAWSPAAVSNRMA